MYTAQLPPVVNPIVVDKYINIKLLKAFSPGWGFKRPECDADHSLPTSAEVKNK